jgi:hypothetical protein
MSESSRGGLSTGCAGLLVAAVVVAFVLNEPRVCLHHREVGVELAEVRERRAARIVRFDRLGRRIVLV